MFSIRKINIVCFFLLFCLGSTQSLQAQMEKIWPVWAVSHSGQYVGTEAGLTNWSTSSKLRYVYNGNDNFAFGFYDQNTFLSSLTGLRFGINRTGTGFSVYADFQNVSSVFQTLNIGDVLELKYVNERYTLSRNGVIIYTYNSTSAYTESLYPYFWDRVQAGLEEYLLFYKEPSSSGNSWYSEGNWRIGTAMLRKGEDGAVQLNYDGGGAAYQVRWNVVKNESFYYTLGRIFYFPNSRKLYMLARNTNPGMSQTTTTSTSIYTIPASEAYVGMDIRMARQGSNLIFYVNGEEIKRFNTDANYDLHPVVLNHATNQHLNVKAISSEENSNYEGGMCQNYFDTKPSFVNAADTTSKLGPAVTNENRNYIHTKIFNGEGEQICHLYEENRTYYDDFGRPTQSQSKDIYNQRVWVSEVQYDELGREAINTLGGLRGGHRIQYANNFVLDNTSQPYNTLDFEGSKLNNPTPIGNNPNTLGWWYSSANSHEEWQATTDFPYSRKEYSNITGAVRRITSPGDAYRMGTGHELLSFTMPVGTDLALMFANQLPMCRLAGNSTYDTDNAISNFCNSSTFVPKYVKTISQSPDGKQTVVFRNRDGQEVARAISGNKSVSPSNLKSTSITVEAGNYHDIHITSYGSNSTSVSFSGTNKNYTIYNLETDAITGSNVNTGSTLSLPEGFYRVVNNNTFNTLTLNYLINYLDYSLTIYDLVGNQIATVAPNDVRYSTSNPVHRAYTFYRYNSWGQILWTERPDEGRIYYFYSKDGKTRFSQNATQIVNNKYNYTKYDQTSRIIEFGECNVLPNGGLSGYTDDPIWPTIGTSSKKYFSYDFADPSFSMVGYTQRNLEGRLSKMSNEAEIIWYSYDELGRLEWIVRRLIGGPSDKVTTYQYDLLGNVTEEVFQAGTTEEFRHQYAYDLNGRMRSVATRQQEVVTTAPVNQSRYLYTLDGKVKKRIIGDFLEKQEFAYTINDQIKSMNPTDMLNADIGSGDRNTFSMALHYYRNDFKSANGKWKDTSNLPTNSTTSTMNSYNGNITATRWKARATIGTEDVSGHFGYRFIYNYREELRYANFAKIIPTSSSSYSGSASFQSDYRTITTYDKNGNITYLRRDAANSIPCNSSIYMDNLYYRYNTSGGKNQLTRIDDTYSNNCIPGEITDQSGTNYSYNERGQLYRDVQANRYIEYNLEGQVSKVRNGTSVTSPLLAEYDYGPAGNRVKKKVYNGSNWVTTWYVSGSSRLLGTYESSNACGGCNMPILQDMTLNAGSRIGLAVNGSTWDYRYELNDHLGNVRSVIKEPSDESRVEVLKYADYYPQGWELPGRSFESGDSYRYAFQGEYAEKDEETGWNAFDLRSYDSRIGRWMTIDPYSQYYSPYLAMGNSPITNVDPDGGFESRGGAWLFAVLHGGIVVRGFGGSSNSRWAVVHNYEGDLMDQKISYNWSDGHHHLGMEVELSFSHDVGGVNLVKDEKAIAGLSVKAMTLTGAKFNVLNFAHHTDGHHQFEGFDTAIEYGLDKKANLTGTLLGIRAEGIGGYADVKGALKYKFNIQTYKWEFVKEAGIGTPFTELKYIESSTERKVRFGLQEEIGISFLKNSVKANARFQIIWKTKKQ